jgi:hypothetical protein
MPVPIASELPEFLQMPLDPWLAVEHDRDDL